MSIQQRIKDWRHALGMTQEQFASRAGIPKRTLVGYENGEREPGAAALAAIARTGANMTWLLTGEGEMVSKELKTQQIRAFQTDAVFRQVEKIGELLDALPEHKRTDLLAEFLSRAEDAAEFISVVRQINELRAAQKKSA